MHDPMTQALVIPFPWFKRFSLRKDGSKGDKYWIPFITIWHVDPCKGPGRDDSCGWFMRSHHGDKEMLEKIRKSFEFDWDCTFTSEGSGKTYFTGLFFPVGAGEKSGQPSMSVHGIVLNLFFMAAHAFFGNRRKAMRWMRRNTVEILIFAENPCDSLRNGIVRLFAGIEEPYNKRRRDERIEEMAACIYGWLLRETRPWWKHPRWHIHHWKLQVHPWQTFRRWVLTRCCKCGGRFKWGESPCTDQWHSRPLKFLRGEESMYHQNCHGASVAPQDDGP